MHERLTIGHKAREGTREVEKDSARRKTARGES